MTIAKITAATAAGLGLALAISASAAASALIHAYEFSVAGSAVDSVGGANGVLMNGATISGGSLHLDGADDWVSFASNLIPTGATPYSIDIRVDGSTSPGHYSEIISQGYSTGPGLYIGTNPSGFFRLTDNFPTTGVAFPTGMHDLLFTTGAGGSKFYIDGALKFSSPLQASGAAGGDFTVFGKQFSPASEFFKGDIDFIRIYDRTLAPGGVPEPATWLLMLVGVGGAGAGLRRSRRARKGSVLRVNSAA